MIVRRHFLSSQFLKDFLRICKSELGSQAKLGALGHVIGGCRDGGGKCGEGCSENGVGMHFVDVIF